MLQLKNFIFFCAQLIVSLITVRSPIQHVLKEAGYLNINVNANKVILASPKAFVMVVEYLLFVLFFLTLNYHIFITECGLTFHSNNLARIAGGQDSNPHSWPSAALVRFYYENFLELEPGTSNTQILRAEKRCGGVLIDRLTVITAAHVIQFFFAI
jgi:hypothetical protein